MIKRILIYSLLLILALPVMAQEGSFSHTSLRLPMASRVAALGGENISVVDDAPWIGSVNPALYSGVSDNSLGLNFMTYFDSGIWAGAEYSKAFGERHTGAVFAQMMNYGKMTETDQNGMELGDFSPKDIVVGVGYSYALTDRWAGGATLKGLYSRYADFSAFALAVDLGLNYYDEEKGISVSAAMKNIGAPIKTFDDRPERLPFDLQLGFTQKMKHAPVQISLTMTDITHWRNQDFYHIEGEKIKWYNMILNHFVVGVDVLPTDYLYISAGYNLRRAYELKAAGSSHWAGFTCGAGLSLKKFKLGASWAKYHRSSSSLMFNVGYSFN